MVFIYFLFTDTSTTENSVTFSTDPYTRTFAMSELDSISEIVDVGENQVSINGFKTERLECGEGFFHGRWFGLNPAGKGHFHGRWISMDGYLLGHLKGHYGVRPDGEKVLFGKWIGIGGSFRGLLRGTWGHDDTDPGIGWLRGRWDNAAGTKQGDFQGGWIVVPPDAEVTHGKSQRRGHGFFRGQYQEICE